VDVPGVRDSLFGTTDELSFLNTAESWFFRKEFISLVDGLSSDFFINWLWEWVYGLVIVWMILLGLDCLMANTFGPSVKGGSPSAISLNSDVVYTTADSEETFFSPMVTPGVADIPIFLAIFISAISYNFDNVVDKLGASLVAIDTSSVLMKIWKSINTASDGTSLDDFLHHVFLAENVSIFISVVNIVRVRDEASIARGAVSALLHW